MTIQSPRARGRPRRFNPDDAVAIAQGLFHAHGYDGVSVADITKALGINPPSFYAAFESKGALYGRVLERYGARHGLPLSSLLRRDRSVTDCLADTLNEAARHYAADPNARGCLVVEGTRCHDRDAREAARAHNLAAEGAIRAYIAERHPAEADRLTDFVATTMFGLSAKARNGHELNQLLATAKLAGSAIKAAIPE